MKFIQRSKAPELITGAITVVGVFVTSIAALVGIGLFVSLAMRTLL